MESDLVALRPPAGAPRWSQRRRVLIVLCLNAALILGLVVVGISAGSVSVLAAVGDTVADCLGLGFDPLPSLR